MRKAFIYIDLFERTAGEFLSDTVMEGVENLLEADPRAGMVIKGLGGVRKIRVSLPGRGKRGSMRLTYLYVEIKGRIYFLVAYPKNAQENLSASQMKMLAARVERLKGEK
jgi:hypothetical protein